MLITGILIFVIFTAGGAAIKYGKQHWLIAGYNTMPAEKQKNVDLAGLANFMGNSLLGLGAFALIGSLITSRWYPNLFSYVIILCSAGTVLIVLGAQKYDHNRKSGHERAVLIAVLSFTAIVLLATVGLLVYGHLSPGKDRARRDHDQRCLRRHHPPRRDHRHKPGKRDTEDPFAKQRL